VEPVSNTIEPEAEASDLLATPSGVRAGTRSRPRLGGAIDRLRGFGGPLHQIKFAVLVYLGSRVLLIVLAIVEGALRHHPVGNEFANWDGMW
jgi:hypothetical protein